MDFKQYGGIPVRVNAIAHKYRNQGVLTDDDFFLMKEFAEIFANVLGDAHELQRQLKAHEELQALMVDFADVGDIGLSGSLGAAQAVPTPAVDHIDHQREEAALLMGLREEWSPPTVDPERSKAWPFPGVEKTIGHTSFIKLSERVDALEKRLARIQGFSTGGLR